MADAETEQHGVGGGRVTTPTGGRILGIDSSPDDTDRSNGAGVAHPDEVSSAPVSASPSGSERS